ncbi:hypothetical protein TMA_064 [Thermus phage TMA]|uniref:hypothetical protein n=1 Tax=Thermus phage TMA TaxID=699370 RepID=UPI00021AAE4F|nr:hypothetical protein TMA_064 [Thermus phage TMA]BAK53752.1 hypothetical protein TMA_064 [Thermus phage TMA]
MFNFIKSLFLIFPTIIQFLSLLLNILKAVESLNNQKTTSEKGDTNKNNIAENKNDSSNKQESLHQEDKTSNKNDAINKERLIELENKSFFVIRCKNDFYSLDESIRKLPPEVFREKYLDFCKKNKVDSSTSKNEVVKNNEESITKHKVVDNDDSRIKQKNVLINKIYFIANKYGLAKDFEALPQEIKELNPEDFKNYAKKNF